MSEILSSLNSNSHIITFIFTHSILKIRSEKKYSTDMTFHQLQGKIEATTGTPISYQELYIMENGQRKCRLTGNPNQLLSEFPQFGNHVIIHCVDKNPSSKLKELSDANLSNIEKYEMDDEIYDQRKDSVRKWKQSILKEKVLANKDQIEADIKAKEIYELKQIELAKNINIDDRCQITQDRRGQVKFNGFVKELNGTFIGIELDEPLGKNDGSIKGKRYFTCSNKYGTFIRPELVEVGDFPEEDIFDEF